MQKNHENDVLLESQHRFDVIGKDDNLEHYEQIKDVPWNVENLLKPSIIDIQDPRTQDTWSYKTRTYNPHNSHKMTRRESMLY